MEEGEMARRCPLRTISIGYPDDLSRRDAVGRAARKLRAAILLYGRLLALTGYGPETFRAGEERMKAAAEYSSAKE